MRRQAAFLPVSVERENAANSAKLRWGNLYEYLDSFKTSGEHPGVAFEVGSRCVQLGSGRIKTLLYAGLFRLILCYSAPNGSAHILFPFFRLNERTTIMGASKGKKFRRLTRVDPKSFKSSSGAFRMIRQSRYSTHQCNNTRPLLCERVRHYTANTVEIPKGDPAF